MTLKWSPLLLLLPALQAATLYSTDFENFPVGPNKWAGTEGWVSSDTTSGAQAIDLDLIPGGGLGKTASIGDQQPKATFTSVVRFFNHDHAATGLTVIEIDCLVGIEDSTNNRRDDFYLSIYNAAGTILASIRFDNQDPGAVPTRFGIWREDGVSQFDTLIDFSHGEIYNLYAVIDLAHNTWSADIGGLPLFTDATFTSNASGAGINFGILGIEWGLTSTGTAGFGNNYLLLADLTVRSVPQGATPFTVAGTRDPATGSVTLAWQGDPGFDYQVQCSTDLVNWSETLPGALFPGITAPGPMTYTDTTTPKDTALYYRVARSETQ